ncbi:MAG: HAMP domain-containing sensor histidine kinase [Gammaproteobacteria bacterium]|nr:HAMP domain-containing sensor histidine kinase [Gammaproteobacteria bacterium]
MGLALTRLQRKVLAVILIIVVVPMLVAGAMAADWVSTHFEHRLEQWISGAAHVDRIWLNAYQNDGLMLGRALQRDGAYRAALAHGRVVPPLAWRNIARQLGLRVIQVYNGDRQLIYSSTPLRLVGHWQPNHPQALLRAVDDHHNMLVAIAVTPIPFGNNQRDYVLLGGLLNRYFVTELAQLTGLETRVYYRDGHQYVDLLPNSRPGDPLRGLSPARLRRLLLAGKADYDMRADTGQFRGLYTPIADSDGHVEAIVFNGLRRNDIDTFLTNRAALFLVISFAGVVIGGLTGLLLSRLIVRPVKDLHNAVMRLASQNFDATVPASTRDELGDLGQAFNAMAARLRMARDDEQKRFRQDKLVALGQLSSALAHEIRNPIGVISAASALLDRPDQTADKQTELKRMIREESARVSALVSDFLKLSRNRPPSPAAIDPAAPMRRAVAGVIARYPEITVDYALQHGQAHILADGDLLQQVWTNLLTNAAEAMNGRGHIRLASSCRGQSVFLSIDDDGPGLDAAVMPRLFEPFFTTKASGTGLGLSIAAALVEANNGHLEAVPQPGCGARFVMRFPLMGDTT